MSRTYCLPVFASMLVVGSMLNPAPAHAQVTAIEMGRVGPDIEPHLEGEWLTIEAPPGGMFQSFQVPAYQGRVRVGHLNYMQNRNVGTNEQRARMRGMAIQRASYQLYLDLLALGENKSVLTPENLGALYTSRKNRGTTVPGAGPWPDLFIWAARGGLSDDSYRDAFCSEAVPCPIDVYSGPRPFQLGTRRQGEAKLLWRNATNEFEFHDAYEHFKNTYAQPLIAWGETIPREVAAVTPTQMSRYDFNTGAYQFRISAGPDAVLPEGRSLEISTPEYDLSFTLSAGSRHISGVVLTWRLDREAAEALRNTMTERQSNQLFVLAEGTMGFQTVDRGSDELAVSA